MRGAPKAGSGLGGQKGTDTCVSHTDSIGGNTRVSGAGNGEPGINRLVTWLRQHGVDVVEAGAATEREDNQNDLRIRCGNATVSSCLPGHCGGNRAKPATEGPWGDSDS
jgi:hypothetical protein